MLFHSLNTGEFVSDLKVSVHLNLVNWTGLKRYWLEFEGVLGACWLLPLFSLCAWGYPCAFPVLRGDKCKYQCDIFHSLCQAVNKALAWKLSLFNNKIFKSYTVLCIFQVKSSWILPVSIVLLWAQKPCPRSFFPSRHSPHDKQSCSSSSQTQEWNEEGMTLCFC